MFGLGMGELLVLLVVALLFLGPEKLPDAAKALSKGIRDLRKQTKELQDTLEEDTQIGDAYRDLRSALRGDERRGYRPKPPKPKNPDATPSAGEKPAPGETPPPVTGTGQQADPVAPEAPAAEAAPQDHAAPGDSAAVSAEAEAEDDLPVVRPASGAVSRGSVLRVVGDDEDDDTGSAHG